MRGVDLTLWVDALSPQLSGIGRYTWELAKGLLGHSDVNRLTFYGRGRVIRDPKVLLHSDEPPPFHHRFFGYRSKFENSGLAPLDTWSRTVAEAVAVCRTVLGSA